MEWLDQAVTHSKFGSGKVKAKDEKTLTVYFSQYGMRTFLYPDAFDQFLKASDPALAQEIQADLERAWQQQADRELEHRKHIEETAERIRLERLEEKRTTAKALRPRATTHKAKVKASAVPESDAAGK